jgi:hypothetical protein
MSLEEKEIAFPYCIEEGDEFYPSDQIPGDSYR